jgi:hypothetical protein
METSSQSPSRLTSLERDLLQRIHDRYGYLGFPSIKDVSVSDRKNTGAGRYTYLMHDDLLRMADGELSAGNYSQFNMDGLEAGACYSVTVKSGKLKYLEILLNGEGFWDGRETTWTVRDPDTGHFP